MPWLLINVGLVLFTGIVVALATVVIVQIVVAVLFGRAKILPLLRPRPSLAVIVPAHNESTGLVRTLASVTNQLFPGDQLLVIADNCTDDTAQVARSAGATVFERCDLSLRGKGFALDFGVKRLIENPPEIVVFCDADVTLRHGALDALAAQVVATGRPAQGVYVLRPSDNHIDVASYIAFLIKNHVRPLGWWRLGGPCTCTGAGIAFDWTTVRELPLASENIVEDMAMSFDLADKGKSAILCPLAFIDGELAPSSTAAVTQRRRWGHGHLQTIFSLALPSLLSFNRQKTALALDVMVPPLTLLFVLLVCNLCVNVGAWAIWPPLIGYVIISAVALLAVVLAVLVGYLTFDESPGKVRNLLSVPRYMLVKLALYLSFFRNRQKSWDRTDRATNKP